VGGPSDLARRAALELAHLHGGELGQAELLRPLSRIQLGVDDVAHVDLADFVKGDNIPGARLETGGLGKFVHKSSSSEM